MRALVTGSRGQLGSELVRLLEARGDVVLGTDVDELDITDAAACMRVVQEFGPDVIFSCAAWTAVDAAEEQEDAAYVVNADGPRNLARAAASTGAWLVQISTDYVFSGDSSAPYRVTDVPDPKSAYGRTKLAGELAVACELPDHHYIVRTAWLYGVTGSNFAKTIMTLADERDSLKVVDDQRGQPTYARDLAEQLSTLIDARPPAGIFHGTNAGDCTWFDFARAVLAASGRDADKVEPCTSEDFPRPAPRPASSVLDHSRWEEVGLAPMRSWQDALTEAFADGLAP